MFTAIFVDDEPLIRKQVSDIFSWIDTDFCLLGTFSNTASAIDFLKVQSVDVVFTDIFLKTTSGLDIARYIYENRIAAKVVLVSAHESFTHAKQGYKYGVSAYINKPFDIAELKELLCQIKGALAVRMPAAENTPLDSSTLNTSSGENFSPRDGKNAITIALDYIEKNCGHDISLSALSASLDLSPSYFSRLFKQTMGVNFSDYLITYRISKAEVLLKESRAPIEVIAQSVGYHHIPLFYNTFKKQTGYTPSEYRKLHGDQE